MELDESGVAGRRVDASTSGLPASMGVVARVKVLSVRRCQQQSAAVVAWAEDVVGNLAASSGLAPGVARYRAVLNSHQTDPGAILREALETEGQVLALYKQLLAAGEGWSVMLEAYARQMVQAEELHAGEVDKMLRRPGEGAAFRSDIMQPG